MYQKKRHRNRRVLVLLHHFYQHEYAYKIKIFKLYTKEREPTDCPSHCFVM